MARSSTTFQKRHTTPQEVREKISKTKTGTKASEETKQKMSESQTGRKHSEETKLKCSVWQKGVYKKDRILYRQLHRRMRELIPAPETCTRCGEHKRLTLHNISGTYPLNDLYDWVYLCHSCHMDVDGRKDKLIERMSKPRRK